MSQKPFTQAAWDETVSYSQLRPGPALTFRLPRGLVFKRIYLYLEAALSIADGDYYLDADVILSLDQQPTAILPASIGSNTTDSFSAGKKSVASLFTAHGEAAGTKDALFVSLMPVGSQNGEHPVVAGNRVAAVALAPTHIVADADRFTWMIKEWSGIVIGYRAFGFVLCSNVSQ